MAEFSLQFEPDEAALRAEFARAGLDALHWDASAAVRVVEETGSTNSDLLAWARQAQAAGAALPARALLLARFQTAGRGRMSRPWQSPRKRSLTFSIGVNARLAPSRLAGLTLVCGLAVHAALADFDLPARLKWPNDLVDAGGRKLGGILVEIVQLGHGGTWVVVGIGINLSGGAALATELGRDVSDLTALGVMAIDPNLLVARIVAQFEQRLDLFERLGFAPFVENFDCAHAWHGHAVEIAGPDNAATAGVFEGVGADGEVRLRLPDGSLRSFISGELSLRIPEA